MTVLVNQEVYQAFESLKVRLSNMANKDEINLLFLSIFNNANGQSDEVKVLREFAINYPTKYLHALVYGYSLDKMDVLKNMIRDWLDKPYVENEEKDIELFAERLTQFFLSKN